MHRVHLASDLHLGAPDAARSRERELRFIGWLEDSAAGRNHAQEGPATEIHLVGDIFDFWHEYKHAVPKGGTRLLGAIARVADSGIPVHYHTGNHDLWTYGYLEEELGVQLHRDPIVRNFDGLTCMIGHGDGLGPVITATNASKKSSLPPSCSGLSVGFTPISASRWRTSYPRTAEPRAAKKTQRSNHPKTNGSGPTARTS